MTDFRNTTPGENSVSYLDSRCFLRFEPLPEVETFNCDQLKGGRYFVMFVPGDNKIIAFAEVMLFGKGSLDTWVPVLV